MVSAANVLPPGQRTDRDRAVYSGDFQIIDNGRLIVGSSPDVGSRIIISPSRWRAIRGEPRLSARGLHQSRRKQHAGRFCTWQPRGQFLYDHSEGTLACRSIMPAGAGILLDNDGSARLVRATVRICWDSASSRSSSSSGLSDEGQSSPLRLTRTATRHSSATSQPPAGASQATCRSIWRRWRLGRPCTSGKLTNEDGSAYAGQILVTDTAENAPGSHRPLATTARATADWQTGQLPQPPDGRNRSGTLVYDGDILHRLATAGWAINSTNGMPI